MYASPRSSPPAPQHSLPGDALPSYPGRTRTGWNPPASPGVLETASKWFIRQVGCDFSAAEAPEKPILPPRREKKPRVKPPAAPTGFEELRYDDAGTDAKPHRFTWESPERWWREPGETDAA